MPSHGGEAFALSDFALGEMPLETGKGVILYAN